MSIQGDEPLQPGENGRPARAAATASPWSRSRSLLTSGRICSICASFRSAGRLDNLEIFVFDNSLTDAVEACVRNVADKRITYVRNLANISDLPALNHQKAFEPRNGLYHMVLSSDWSLNPRAIELMVEALRSDGSICAVASEECQINLATGERTSRERRFEAYTIAGGPGPHGPHDRLDGGRMIRDAFSTLTGIGMAYHSLIASDLLRYGNLERTYLSQAYEHQLSLELLMQKPAFGLIRKELLEELLNDRRFQEGVYRKYRRFTEAVARQRFIEKHSLELLTRGFDVTRLQLGLAVLFARCMYHWDERPFDAARHFFRLALPLAAAAIMAPIYLPLGLLPRLRKYRIARKRRMRSRF